jgi:hypothetical protein
MPPSIGGPLNEERSNNEGAMVYGRAFPGLPNGLGRITSSIALKDRCVFTQVRRETGKE